MVRPLRIEYPGAYYHVMNRGLARSNIFLDNHDRQRFLTLIGEVSKLWKIEVYVYCLMGNHYHLLLQTPNGGLSRAMRHLDGVYTQGFNRAHRRDGPLLRGRYRAILIDAEEYLLAVARYIHHNPVGARIVSNMDHYRWSSHYGYLAKRKAPEWLNTDSILSRFGQGRRGLMQYQSFMHSKVEKEIQEYYTKAYFRPVLGSKVFVQGVMEKIGKSAEVDGEKPESRRVFGWEIEEIVRATAKVYGKTVLDLRVKRRGEQNEARSMAMYLCRTLGGHKLTEIGKVVGLEKYSSVSTAYLRVKERMGRERRLTRRAREIENQLLKRQEQS
ncbi:MAG: transposase [Candidatus Binatia bacterium]